MRNTYYLNTRRKTNGYEFRVVTRPVGGQHLNVVNLKILIYLVNLIMFVCLTEANGS